ncbi:UNVERIFIED_ORG: molybdopterin synthase sulfur carrier subunit [Zoogloea ramigera]|uniref:Molybdopterin synthase sulfur carrier subunit n=1 Tax=Duganella zoogloeoides TaxID=75659 RepID=A0ABZ0Y4L2_9BURK|nr:molybdopterin converting factor subunit 1 [Duganella zoogloeoides]WQH06985.1 molybdopterin converting factor subunit 1 [Duganella zoogloeoides]
MAVTVKFFASVREAVGVSSDTLVLPVEVATVGDLREHLSARGANWRGALASPALRMACNQVMCDAATPVPDGAEVAFFPPVTGG